MICQSIIQHIETTMLLHFTPNRLRFGYIIFAFVLICTPATLLRAENNGFVVITAPETKLMLEQDPTTRLINVLSSLEYELQHIPNSISIPVNQLKDSPLLPKDKNIPLIFYCMGPR